MDRIVSFHSARAHFQQELSPAYKTLAKKNVLSIYTNLISNIRICVQFDLNVSVWLVLNRVSHLLPSASEMCAIL